MSRKLASVQYVHDIWPIEGADRVEAIGVLGWKCVAKKGEFKVGDWCVYFEIDAFLPIDDRFEFLRSTSYKNSDLLGEGFRLKTQRFRGQVSQGLALPMNILPEGEYELGQNVSDLLGVRKWQVEERASSSGTIIATLPAGVPKTEETRIQAEPGLIEEFAGLPYYITTKMDGTSVSMYLMGEKFGVCGHNYEYADDGACPFWQYAHEHDIEARLRAVGADGIVLQGEFCGGGIQGNPLKLRRPEWFIFSICDYETHRRWSLGEMAAFCDSLGLARVPLEEMGERFAYDSVDSLLERARGIYASGVTKEGIVVRPVDPAYSKLLQASLSMKVINNDYLLKKGKKG